MPWLLTVSLAAMNSPLSVSKASTPSCLQRASRASTLSRVLSISSGQTTT
jgi:hypothetical protein